MTLDGHVKVGLVLAPAVFCFSPSLIPGIDTFNMLILAIFVLLGSVFPDFSEMGVIPHRTYTHFWPLYLVPAMASYYFLQSDGVSMYSLAGLGLSSGALIHILCDWPYYGGCPLFSPKRKVALFRITFEGAGNRVLEYGVIGFVLFLCLLEVSPEDKGMQNVHALFSSQ